MESLATQVPEWTRILVAKASASPLTVIVIALLAICLGTRLTSGRSPRTLEGGLRAPGVLPHWVPYLGHALWLAFFPEKLQEARSATPDGVFAISMAGVTHNIVVKPSLAKAVFALKSSIVSSNALIYYLMEQFFGVPKEYCSIIPEALIFKDVHHVLNLLMKESYLEKAMQLVADRIEATVPNLVSPQQPAAPQSPWERAARVESVAGDPDAVEASFFPLIRTFVACVASPAVMGHAFMDNNPGIIQDLWDFDLGMAFFLMQLPRWLPLPSLRRAYAARRRLRAALEDFHTALAVSLDGRDPGPRWTDLSDVSELMWERNRTWRAGGIPVHVWAGGEMSLYWALNVNSNNIVFWLLTRLYASPAHLARIRAEIEPFVRPHLVVPALTKACPLLRAALYECMRLDTASTTIKTVEAPFTVTEAPADAFAGAPARSYRIGAGGFVHVDHGLHQMDPRYYPAPGVFRPERFLVGGEGEGQGTAKVEGQGDEKRAPFDAHQGTIRPFGGGHNLCKGYKFAEREILLFAAGILTAWDVEAVGGSGDGASSGAVPGHVRGSGAFLPRGDFRVRMRRRRGLV